MTYEEYKQKYKTPSNVQPTNKVTTYQDYVNKYKTPQTTNANNTAQLNVYNTLLNATNVSTYDAMQPQAPNVNKNIENVRLSNIPQRNINTFNQLAVENRNNLKQSSNVSKDSIDLASIKIEAPTAGDTLSQKDNERFQQEKEEYNNYSQKYIADIVAKNTESQKNGTFYERMKQEANLYDSYKAYYDKAVKNKDIQSQAFYKALLQNAEYAKQVNELTGKYDSSNFGANYTMGDLQTDLNDAVYEYIKYPYSKRKSENAEKIRQAEELIQLYSENAENVGKGGLIAKDFATYFPQAVEQFKSGVKGAIGGGVAGGAIGTAVSGGPGAGTITGIVKGGQAGYAAGVAQYSYNQMLASSYKGLIDLDVPPDIALEVATDTALWQSIIEGVGAGVDVATLGIGKLFSKGAKTAAQLTAKKMITKALKAYGINLASETAEEAIQEKIAIEGEKKALKQAGIERTETEQEDMQRIIESGFGGFKIALVTGGGNVIGNVTVNTINNSTINSVNKQYDDYINQIKQSDLTETQKQEMIVDAENGRQDTMNAIQEQIEQAEGKKVVNLQKTTQNNTNLAQTSPNTANISQNNAQNVSNLENTVQSKQSLGIQQSKEIPQVIQTFVENRNKTAPGLNIQFDNTLNTDGRIIRNPDGTRTISINPNSTRAYEFVVIHEMMHDLENTQEFRELSKYVKDRAITHEEFEKAKQAITEQYTKYYTENNLDMSGLNMEVETTNDMVAQALGNQEFLNQLAGEKPSVFMRMYNWVKNVLFDGQNTGKTFKERRAGNKYLQELKNKFETAYNTAYKGNYNIQYSLKGRDKNGYPIYESDLIQEITNKEKIKHLEAQMNLLKSKAVFFNINGEKIKAFFDDYGVQKTTYGTAKGEKAETRKGFQTKEMLATDLYTIINNSKYVGEADEISNISNIPPKNRAHQDVRKWYTFENKINYNGEIYTVLTTVRKKDDGNYGYSIKFYENKKNNSVQAYSLKNFRDNTHSSYINSIPSNNNVVNNQYMQKGSNNTQNSTQSSFSLSEETKGSRLKYLNEEFELYDKAREQAYDLRDEAQKKYDDIIKTDEYKNALTYVTKNLDKKDTEEFKSHYSVLVQAQKWQNEIKQYQADVDAANKEMTRITELITNEEKEAREPKKAVRQAKKEFGITNDFKEAGYLLQDGSLLDFSGRNQGSGAVGRRTLDHRDINTVGYDMDEFIALGNIRLQPESNGFELISEPTEKQYSALKRYIDSADGEVFIDIYKEGRMANYDSAEYKKGTPTSKIINDLQYYFKNGKFPLKSALADFRYSQSNNEWQNYLDKNWNLMPNAKKSKTTLPTQAQLQAEQEAKRSRIPKLEDIADLTQKDADLPSMKYKAKADRNTTFQRKFFENMETSKIISDKVKEQVTMTTYEQKKNLETLERVKENLDTDINRIASEWFRKDIKKATDEDVALGAILVERYQQEGKFEDAVDVVQKLADMGTEAGRTVQMYSIFQRLTPEGMMIYQQRKLNSALEDITKKQTGKWVEQNKDKFKLTEDDATFITAKVQEAQNAPTERQKQIALAEIEKRINDKLPPEAGQSVKAFRRIAMLFNPKTQVRNVVGNMTVMPLNYVTDLVATGIDKAVAKKTGIRTTALPNVKTIAKGAKKGLSETIDDYKTGIRTTPTGSKYEIQNNVKSFNENTNSKVKNAINKKMNAIDRLLSSVMEAGDRPFYEASYQNALESQMKTNGVTTPTQEMIDIASNVALSQTWQDNNNYTQAVLGIRSAFNKININGFGLGDLIIPFAKTPANLTKAMVDYSPAGFIPSLINYNDMRKAISRGEMTAMQQKKFVTSVGKAIAGTILYTIAGALAKGGGVTGSSDEDKDVANFEKNVLGIQPYSIKIGDKTYTYNWAQPLATPLAIMSDTYKMSEEGAKWNEILVNGFKVAGDQLVANSFLQGIQELLSSEYGNESAMDNLVGAIMDLPTQFTPTLFGQIATQFDSTKRQTFENGDTVGTMWNEVKNKLPGAKNTLAPQVNTFGEEIQNYGGANNPFNVFLNPGNISSTNATDTQKELYALYEVTKDKTIFPRQAPYSVSGGGEKVTLSSQDRADYQKTSGQYVTEQLDALFNSEFYKTLEDDKKVDVVAKIVGDADTTAKDKWIDTETTERLAELKTDLEESGIPLLDYYNAWIATQGIESDKNWKGETITNSKSKKQKEAIDKATPDLDKWERRKLYEIFNVGKSVW